MRGHRWRGVRQGWDIGFVEGDEPMVDFGWLFVRRRSVGQLEAAQM